MSVSAERQHSERFKVAGAALLLLAVLMFIGSFVAAANTPAGYDVNSCRGRAGQPCDPLPDSPDKHRVFFSWIGAALVVFVGGVWLRSVGSGPDTT
jgi:hypothetical protein